MIRQFFGALGVLTALVPDRIVDVFEAIVVENTGEDTVNSWFCLLIRTERVVVTLAALRDGRLYARSRLCERIAGALSYENPESVERNEHLTDGVRVIGAVSVPLALSDRRRRNGS